MTRPRLPLRDLLRWRVALAINLLPRACWPDLVMFAQRDRRWPWVANRSCRADAARTGYCYCGKVRNATPTAPGPEVAR